MSVSRTPWVRCLCLCQGHPGLDVCVYVKDTMCWVFICKEHPVFICKGHARLDVYMYLGHPGLDVYVCKGHPGLDVYVSVKDTLC